MRRPGRQIRHVGQLWHSWAAPVFAGLLLAFFAAGNLAAAPAARAATTASCDGPVQGKHVYDCAGILTPAEIADLERHAQAVVQAGAPTVVYLQAKDAGRDQTIQDAADLMQFWHVESRPDAHDGFVMLINLQPGNLRHGQVGLFAGQKHASGNLPPYNLDRIYADVMLPALAAEHTADGIAAGLDAVAHDLAVGPPPETAPISNGSFSGQPDVSFAPSPQQLAVRAFGRLPLNLAAFAYLAVVLALAVAARRSRPRAPIPTPAILTPPGDLAPALAGALVKGRISSIQLEATILDFARRGLLAMESDRRDRVRVRLKSPGDELTGYEARLWMALRHAADDDGVIHASDMHEVPLHWSSALDFLRADLVKRGWYDPFPGNRRTPLYMAGGGGLIGCLVAFIVAFGGLDGWPMLASLTFLGGSIAAFILGHAISDTTTAGQEVARPWRAYRDTLNGHAYNAPAPEAIDRELPYAVAMGISSTLSTRLGIAGQRGYAPSYFAGAPASGGGYTSFYPYWIGLHSAMYPPPPPSSYRGGYTGGGYTGGGFSGGGGAAAGGGGGGGAF